MNVLRKQPAASRACRPKRPRSFPTAWIKRVQAASSRCRGSPLVDPAIDRGDCRHDARRQLARTALVLRLTRAARRFAGVPPERSQNFRRHGSGQSGRFYVP